MNDFIHHWARWSTNHPNRFHDTWVYDYDSNTQYDTLLRPYCAGSPMLRIKWCQELETLNGKVISIKLLASRNRKTWGVLMVTEFD
jgi:hypothetical protein